MARLLKGGRAGYILHLYAWRLPKVVHEEFALP